MKLIQCFAVLFLFCRGQLDAQFKQELKFERNADASIGVEDARLDPDLLRSRSGKPNGGSTVLTQPGPLKKVTFGEAAEIYRDVDGIYAAKGVSLFGSQGAADGAIEQFLVEQLSWESDGDNQTRIFDVRHDEYYKVIKVQQYYRGLKVYGAQAVFHEQGGGLNFFLGHLRPDLSLEKTVPNILPDQLEVLMEDEFPYSSAWDVPVGIDRLFAKDRFQWELVVYPYNGKDILCYHVIAYPDRVHPKELFVDAQTGEVIHAYDAYCKLHDKPALPDALLPPEIGSGRDVFNVQHNNLKTWSSGGTYFLIDASQPMFREDLSTMPNNPVGAIWTLDGNNGSPQRQDFSVTQHTDDDNNWGDPVAVTAHLNAQKAYDYFRNTFGRNSINGTGGTIVSITNITDPNGNSMGNAFWNGQAIFYGNGDAAFKALARGLDVAGHEMSHGVIQATANLRYQGESGALNESFADIFGAMIDRDDWLIGEDVVRPTAFPSGALRDMQNPHNGGSGLQDVGKGWQPAHYDERYTGQENNGGVHINSGIANRAYVLFASDSRVGKSTAEQIYYKVLTEMLTVSSDFADLRTALEFVVDRDYGMDSGIWAALQNAMNQTGMPGGGQINGGGQEFDTNPGDQFLLMTTQDAEGIYYYDLSGGTSPIKLYDINLLSKPSVTDDGSFAMFIDGQNRIRFMSDWAESAEIGFAFNPPLGIWRNVVVSKQGDKFAALTDSLNNALYVFDLVGQNVRRYVLTNPTYTDGVVTGDVLYPDAIEFDHFGEYIMYDALNRIEGQSGEDIDYWDIGFVEVWDNQGETFAGGRIHKLFNGLPDNASIGNPTFSKNDPNRIAFDLLEGNEWYVLEMNIETRDLGLVVENNTIGYPNYDVEDKLLIYDRKDGPLGQEQALWVSALKDEGLGSASAGQAYISGGHWGVWYADGARIISSVEDEFSDSFSWSIYPNPVTDRLYVNARFGEFEDFVRLRIFDVSGRSYGDLRYNSLDRLSVEIDMSGYSSGLYVLQLQTANEVRMIRFVKVGS